MKNDDSESIGHAVFMCTMCKKIYKNPGMCNHCDAVLKPKGG